MKLQHLTVIFIIILLPVVLILSEYIQTQIDTVALRSSYDTKLMDATHDAIEAFQLNTINNEYSTVSDSMKRDVQAAINTFFNSISNNFGVPGYTEEYIKPYVPALLFTLYDGYYIYAPTNIDGNTEYILKPYVYYSARYVGENGYDFVVNYSLDNYISIYGNIKGKYVSKSGYLIAEEKSVNNNEVLKECIGYKIAESGGGYAVQEPQYYSFNYAYNESTQSYYKVYSDGTQTFTINNGYRNDVSNVQIENDIASKYYDTSFTKWVNDNLGVLKIGEKNGQGYYAIGEAGGKKIFNIEANNNNNPEEKNSIFSEHKYEVIKNSIQENLQSALNNYAGASSYNFKMPILSDTDWEQLFSNVSLVSFMQGMPVGTTIYNNYVIVTSTGNNEHIPDNGTYFVVYDEDGNEESYHRATCQELKESAVDSEKTIVGYKAIDFAKTSFEYEDDTGKNITRYYYKHDAKACYKCIVESNYSSLYNDNGGLNIDNIKKAYYISIARERYAKYKATSFLNLTNNQE